MAQGSDRSAPLNRIKKPGVSMALYAHTSLRELVSEARQARSRVAVKNHAHIVDVLIAERATGLASHWSWPIIRPMLYRLLGHKRAVTMSDIVADMSGPEAMSFVSTMLNLQLDITGLDRIPRQGPFILAANHPTGIADGVAVYDLVKARRPDIAIFTNRDAVRVARRFDEVLIPVEWREDHKSREKTKETLIRTAEAFEEGKSVVLFPSGRIAYWADDQLNERPWQATLVTLARRYKVPIVPVHVRSRNSGLFYLFSRISSELRDMTVFYELLNKSGTGFGLSVGKPIPHESLVGDANQLTTALQAHTVTTLAQNRNAVFESVANA